MTTSDDSSAISDWKDASPGPLMNSVDTGFAHGTIVYQHVKAITASRLWVCVARDEGPRTTGPEHDRSATGRRIDVRGARDGAAPCAGQCRTDAQSLGCRGPPPMEARKRWGQRSGVCSVSRHAGRCWRVQMWVGGA